MRTCRYELSINDWTEEDAVFMRMIGVKPTGRYSDGDFSYETFYFPRKLIPEDLGNSGKGEFCFQFCKTAQKPYDIAVAICLIIIKQRLKNNIKVSSDGDNCDWIDAKMICQRVLDYGTEYQINADGELISKS